MLDSVDYEKVARLNHTAVKRTHAQCKQRHIRKFEALLSRNKKKLELHPEAKARWVINLSMRNLTPSQEEILKMGLNFTLVPTKFCCRTLLQVWRRLPS